VSGWAMATGRHDFLTKAPSPLRKRGILRFLGRLRGPFRFFPVKRSLLLGIAAAAAATSPIFFQAPAQAATCSLGALGTCNQTIGDFTFSGFSISGFSDSGSDVFDLTTTSPASAQVQISWSPVRDSGSLSGSFSYTVTLGSGRTFNQAQANITGSLATFATALASAGLPVDSTSTGGPGTTVSFNSNLTSATFTQTFSYTGTPASSFFNSVGAAITTTPPGTAETPGPLPLLGAGAAFGFSRKLRSRIKLAA